MINAALNLMPAAAGQSRPLIIGSQISTTRPAPSSYSDPLYIDNPAQEGNFWTVQDWTVDHGGTLPQQGAACALMYDYNGVLRCIWWEGLYSAPAPGGTAGGDLSGTFPNPTVAKINGTTVPLTGAAWIAPTLLNSWTNLGSGYETAAYLKDPLGFVHLKGVLTGGASNSIAFTLPAGYRPGATTDHPCGGSNNVVLPAVCQIASGGNVTLLFNVVGGTGALNAGLSGITFLAEN